MQKCTPRLLFACSITFEPQASDLSALGEAAWSATSLDEHWLESFAFQLISLQTSGVLAPSSAYSDFCFVQSASSLDTVEPANWIWSSFWVKRCNCWSSGWSSYLCIYDCRVEVPFAVTYFFGFRGQQASSYSLIAPVNFRSTFCLRISWRGFTWMPGQISAVAKLFFAWPGNGQRAKCHREQE